jgi:TRAP-type C4-dicarboxylate transport system permease small subunit
MVESFEISGYALAACVGLGLSFTVTTKANIRVDFITAKLPFPLRAAFDLAASLALALVASALAWFTWKTLGQSWTMGAKSISQMQVPMVIPQGLWWVGLFWFAGMAVLAPVQAAMRLVAGDRRGFETLVGSASLEAEIGQAGVEADADEGADR